CALTAPFHPCLCRANPAIGGLFSVARSARSPPPGSRQHRCSVEPRPSSAGPPKRTDRGHPRNSPSAAMVPPLSGSGVGALFAICRLLTLGGRLALGGGGEVGVGGDEVGEREQRAGGSGPGAAV